MHLAQIALRLTLLPCFLVYFYSFYAFFFFSLFLGFPSSHYHCPSPGPRHLWGVCHSDASRADRLASNPSSLFLSLFLLFLRLFLLFSFSWFPLLSLSLPFAWTPSSLGRLPLRCISRRSPCV